MNADFQKELQVKADLLWEDISGATTKSMRGYGKLQEVILSDYEEKVRAMTEASNKLIQLCN